MTADEAQRAGEAYYQHLIVSGELPNNVIDAWSSWEPIARECEGFWFVDYCGAGGYLGTQGVAVRPDGTCRLVFGAHGNAWNQWRQGAGLANTSRSPNPGFPVTNERYLGSSTLGRYQTFERMDVVWEGGRAIDTGFVRFGPDRVERDCSIAAVVIDIRDFTPFSQVNTARTVQDVLNDLEQVVQEKFARGWKSELFVKGTGDGALLVSEEEWVSGDLVAKVREASEDVIRRCRVLSWYKKEPANLAVGIGIDCGEAKRISLWGRPDYISPCINRAAKMQTFASDEIAISREVGKVLGIDLVFKRDDLHDIEYALVSVAPR